MLADYKTDECMNPYRFACKHIFEKLKVKIIKHVFAGIEKRIIIDFIIVTASISYRFCSTTSYSPRCSQSQITAGVRAKMARTRSP